MLLKAGYCDTAAASVRKRSPSPAILKRRQSERMLASAAVERGRSSERKAVGARRARSPSPQPQARPQQRRAAGNWSAATSSSSEQLPSSSPWLQRQSTATLPSSSESGNQGPSRPLQRESTVLFPTSDDAPQPAPAASSRSLRRRAAFVFSDEEGDALFGHGPVAQAVTSTQPAALEPKAPNPFMVIFNQLVAAGKRKREPDANADADIDNTSPTKRRRTTQDARTVERNASLRRASTPALVEQSQPQPSLLTRVKRPMAGAARMARSLFGKSSVPEPTAVLVSHGTDGAIVS
ncbi:hypothetical protein EXIGLDRAFT_153505 [Exidia glandulosa HHB12029]|uniref:Uncharacterized protein n=1 Tax=Exidia glandulosa HHB12029 TaxID=1314781 RepID=A0A166BS35_EXIGL|nr:hypothetical protein EXIGLDRAFT_153505 [Exidia glandulosa HHB12029]